MPPPPTKKLAAALVVSPNDIVSRPSPPVGDAAIVPFALPMPAGVPAAVKRSCIQVLAAAPPVSVTTVGAIDRAVSLIVPTLTDSMPAAPLAQSVVEPNVVFS